MDEIKYLLEKMGYIVVDRKALNNGNEALYYSPEHEIEIKVIARYASDNTKNKYVEIQKQNSQTEWLKKQTLDL